MEDRRGSVNLMSMLHVLFSVLGGAAGPTVDMADDSNFNFSSFGTVIANFKIDNDGDCYRSDNSGSYLSSSQTWLDAGTNDQVWIERTVNSGTLDTDTIGTGRVAMTTDRIIGVTDSVQGGLPRDANVTVSFYDASSGGTLLDTADVVLQADYTDDI